MTTDDGIGAPWRPLTDLRADARRRLGTYLADWRDGLHPKVIASTLFLFFACLAPAVAFGGLMSEQTGGAIGVVEMIVATAVCGILYAIFSGQPLTILGGTGPLLVFTGLLYRGCVDLGVAFLPTYAWVGLWTGLFVLLMAFTGASRLIRHFTRFTDETFAALISLIFIYEAVYHVGHMFPSPHVADDGALLSTLLALGTFYIASSLSRMRRGPYLRPWIREFLADFGPAIAVVSMTGARWLLPGVALPHLDVPEHLARASGRGWIVPLGDVPAWVPWAAAAPAMLAAVLVFLDQNITTRLVNAPRNRLARGPAYHLDMLVVGLLLAACSVVGLPWLVAATVRSLSHVRSLSEQRVDASGGEQTAAVRENRVSGLAIHALVGAALLATGALRAVPMAVLYGLFLYMGLSSMRGNDFLDRVRLWATDPERYPATHYIRHVSPGTLHRYTAVQLACLAALWFVKASRFGILFPLALLGLVAARAMLPRWLAPGDVARLDSDEEPADAEFRSVE